MVGERRTYIHRWSQGGFKIGFQTEGSCRPLPRFIVSLHVFSDCSWEEHQCMYGGYSMEMYVFVAI